MQAVAPAAPRVFVALPGLHGRHAVLMSASWSYSPAGHPGGSGHPLTVNVPPTHAIAGLVPRTVHRFTPSPPTVVPVGSAIS